MSRSRPAVNPSPARRVRNEFVELIEVLRRRLPLFMLCITLGIVAGLAYYVIAEPTYKTEARIMVMRKNPNLSSRVSDAFTEETRISEELLSTHMTLLQSPRNVRAALEKNGLDQLPRIIANRRSTESSADYVVRKLKVTRGGTGASRAAHLLNLTFEHPDPDEAQQIVQAILESYRSFLRDKFKNVNEEVASLINETQASQLKDLAEAESRYTLFREQLPMLTWKYNDNLITEHSVRLQQLERELSEAYLAEADLRALLTNAQEKLAEIDERGGSDVERLSVIDDRESKRLQILLSIDSGESQSASFQGQQPLRAELAKLETSKTELELKLRTLLQSFGAQHPEVQTVRTQLNSIDSFIDDLRKLIEEPRDTPQFSPRQIVKLYVGLLQNDLLAASRKVEEIKTLTEAANARSREIVGFELEDDALRKQVTRSQSFYDDLVLRLRDLNMIRDTGGFVNEIIVEPDRGRQSGPRLSLALLLGSLGGLLVGTIAVAIEEYRDRRFRSVDEMQESLQIPVLSQIPSLINLGGAARRDQANDAVSASVHTFHHPASPRSEAFRALRTMLLAAGREDQPLQVIQFTSPMQGDGKTTIVTNLAVTLAQTGKKVLLVDCDMRRPSVHQLFKVKTEFGLSTVVEGETHPLDAIQESAVPNLSILSSGPIPDQPAEMLANAAFAEFIQVCREKYDLILLDCPPVLPVTDPCVVAPLADGTVFVVRMARDPRLVISKTLESLNDVAANVVGCVVNVPDTGSGFEMLGYRQGGYGYGGYGYGGYGYGGYGYGGYGYGGYGYGSYGGGYGSAGSYTSNLPNESTDQPVSAKSSKN